MGKIFFYDAPMNMSLPAPRRLLKALLGLILVWVGLCVLAWAVMPMVLRTVLERQASEALGRPVGVAGVDVRPWSLELTLTGLRLGSAKGLEAPQLEIDRLYIDAELQSLLRWAPVVDALQVQGVRGGVRHLGQGRYDIDDVLQRLAQRPASPDSALPRFALFNLRLEGVDLDFEDTPRAVTHRLRGLNLAVPFLSNLPSRRDVQTEPHLAFELNGSAFDSRASSTPFASTQATQARLKVAALDLSPYWAYWPGAWPMRPVGGRLDLDLALDFLQADIPRVALSGDLSLGGLSLQSTLPSDPLRGQPWMAFDRLQLPMAEVLPLERSVKLGDIQWEGLRLHLARTARAGVNLPQMLAAWVPAIQPGAAAATPTAEPQAPPWRVQVGSVALKAGQWTWTDEAVPGRAEAKLEAVDLRLGPLRYPMTEMADLALTARLGAAAVAVQGQASDQRFALDVTADGMDLTPWAPYIRQSLKPRLQANWAGQVRLEGSPADWRASGALQARNLRLFTPEKTWLSLQALDLDGFSWDASRQRLEVADLRLRQPRLELRRLASGRWMFEEEAWWQAPPAAETGPRGSAASDGPGFASALQRLKIEGLRVALDDAAPARPVQLVLSDGALELAQWRSDRPVRMPLKLSARLASAESQTEAGVLAWQGHLGWPAVQLAGQIDLQRWPLHALEPYFGAALNLELLRADASARGQLDVGWADQGLSLAYRGDLSLDDLRANTLTPSEELLSWKSLAFRNIDLAHRPDRPLRLRVGDAVLSDYYARVLIDEQGRINLQNLLKARENTTGATPATSTTAAAAPVQPVAAPPDIAFGPIALVNGRVRFSDRFIKPNYSANLSELSGQISAFSNTPEANGGPVAQADVRLRGRAEGTATLEISGRLNPLVRPLALDLKGQVRDLELPPLSPYAIKYAGYGIERGKLSVDVAYQITPDGRLTASNQVVLNQLTFGERDSGSDAPNLPVKLAVALLADRQGVIDINLPISGSLSDPQFSLGPVIWKVVLNLIGKAITAPFALLANAFGSSAEEGAQVLFAPGSPALSAEARARLDRVAQALQDRPALRLTVVGHSDPAAEDSAYRRERLQEWMRAEKRRALLRQGAAADAPVDIAPPEAAQWLKEVYSRTDMPKPRNLLGLAKDIPPADMEALLLAHVRVTPDALRELALQRSVAVKDHMVARSLPVERVFLGAPVVGSSAPRAELQLATR